MHTRSIPNDSDVTVYGVTFHGIEDLLNHAINKQPKDGVYVGEVSKHYPCFDSSDYAYETRFYWNIFFAKSPDELKRKQEKLENEVETRLNYRKLSDATPADVMPVIYYEGDTNDPLWLPVCPEISFDEAL